MSTPPVVFVPGLPASHLIDTRSGKRIFLSLDFKNSDLKGPDDLAAPEPISAGFPIRKAASLLIWDLGKQAGTLYQILNRMGIDPIKVGWDWRRPVYDDQFTDPAGSYSVQSRLRDVINGANQKVVVIVHSTGGLVLRSLLEAEPALADKIKKVIAFGIPWAGTPKAMEIVNAQTGFAGIVSPERAQKILTPSWAGWDLFPPSPQHLSDSNGNPLMLTLRKNGGTSQQVSALVDRDWIASLPSQLQAKATARAIAAHSHLGSRKAEIDLGGRSLEVVNVAGWGSSTPVRAILTGQGSQAKMKVEHDTEDSTLHGGDGTVPYRSAAWLRGGGNVDVKTYSAPVGRLPSTRTLPHSRLWSNPIGRDLLRHHLGGDPLGPMCYAAMDSSDTVQVGPAQIRVRLVALDPDGTALPSGRVRTRNLQQGPQQEETFDPSFEGRHIVTIPRNRIRSVGSGLRRLELEIGWDDNGSDRWQKRSFLFPA